MFVSGLSVSEFVLFPHLSVLGVVKASIVYHTREIDCPSTTRKMVVLTRSRTRLLQTVYDRMHAEARKMGAGGIIDCCRTEQEIAQNVWELTVQGTAIGYGPPMSGTEPFACTFSGQDYFLLAASGWQPLGVAFGVSIYYQSLHKRVQQKVSSGQNTERSDFTRGLYSARKDAMLALEEGADRLGSAGVMGISVTAKRMLNREYGTDQGMMIEFTAVGTAIAAAPTTSHFVPAEYGVPLN